MPPSAAFEPMTTAYPFSEFRRTAALPIRLEESFTRQQKLQERDPWASSRPLPTLKYATYSEDMATNTQPLNSFSPPVGLPTTTRKVAAYPPCKPRQSSWTREEWPPGPTAPVQDMHFFSAWATSPLTPHLPNSKTLMSPENDCSPRSSFAAYQTRWPGIPPRRDSADEAQASRPAVGYQGSDNNPCAMNPQTKPFPQRRPSNRDEFDGPSQLLDKPNDNGLEPQEEDLPQLPVTLYTQEQDSILSDVNDRLSLCAYDFVAKYQFPVPLEPDKRPVRAPGDREWSEWVYLLKRLATKRRIPARVLYNGQIRQLITVLENSLEMRHTPKSLSSSSRPLKDDRNVLQLVSSGLQVAKILKDAPAMRYLDALYSRTEGLIRARRAGLPRETLMPLQRLQTSF